MFSIDLTNPNVLKMCGYVFEKYVIWMSGRDEFNLRHIALEKLTCVCDQTFVNSIAFERVIRESYNICTYFHVLQLKVTLKN